MEFNPREQAIVGAVFGSIIAQFNDDELNRFLGWETIQEMKTLKSKMDHDWYCKKHGIRYEDMTEDDFISAAEESAYLECCAAMDEADAEDAGNWLAWY